MWCTAAGCNYHWDIALTFGVMALTIAALSVANRLILRAFAHLLRARVKAHKRWARMLQCAAGVFLLGFGIWLGTQ